MMDSAAYPPSPPAPPQVPPPLPPGYQGVPPTVAGIGPQPGAPPKKSRTGLWVGLGVGAGVAGVAVVVGLFLFAWSGTSAGASSPQAAVEGLVDSLGNKDVAGALTSLAPGEITGIDELWRTTQQKTEELGTGDAPKVTGDALVFEARKFDWDVEEVSGNTARVTLTGVDATIGFDAAALGLDESARTRLEDLGPDRVDGDHYLWTLSTEDLPREGVKVVTVKRDGGWFVSPLYTVGEYAYEGSKKAQRRGPPDYAYDPDSVGTGATTAAGSVEALAHAVEGGTAEDIAGVLSPRQVAFLHVYQALDDGKATPSDLEIGGLSLSEEPLGEGRTRVRVQSADVSWRGGSVEIDGDCWQLERRGSERKGCINDVLPQGSESLAHLLPNSVSFVAIEQGGKWYVDPLQSVTLILNDFVSALTPADTDEIKDLVGDLQKLSEDESEDTYY